jgi:hypothetical protein
VTHLAIALFFSMIFIGIGIAGQLLVREYWQEILAALHGRDPVRPPAIDPRFRVQVRPNPQFATVRSRHAAA